MDDDKIIDLYWTRSEKAIVKTRDKYGKYCYCIAFNILGNKEDAEECVNDTYLKTWNAIPPTHPKRLQTFLGKITRNLSLNMYEKRIAEKRGYGQIPILLDELEACIPDTKTSDCMTEDIVLKDLLNRFLKSLTPRVRKIFVRRYWYACSIEEISKEYHMSESNVAVTLFRTRKKLKTLLEKEGIFL